MTSLHRMFGTDPLTKFLFDDTNSTFFHQHPLGYLKKEPGQSSNKQFSADVFESESHYFVQIDVPGISKDDISVEFEDGLLVVKGERNIAPPAENASKIFSSQKATSIHQNFRLPLTVDPEKISGSYKDGVLSVTIEKRKKPEPVRIKLAAEA
jgi:HSP20 family molecular chaperone IbpA